VKNFKAWLVLSILFLSFNLPISFAVDDVSADCSDHLVSVESSTPPENMTSAIVLGDEAQEQKTISFLYYPMYPSDILIGTALNPPSTQISIDSKIYGTMGAYYELGKYETVKRKSHIDRLIFKFIRYNPDAFIELKFAITDEQFEEAKKIVASGHNKSLTTACVAGSCDILRRGAGISVPPPFNLFPTAALLYLLTKSKIGLISNKMTVEYHGTGKSKFFPYGTILETAVVTGFLYSAAHGFSSEYYYSSLAANNLILYQLIGFTSQTIRTVYRLFSKNKK